VTPRETASRIITARKTRRNGRDKSSSVYKKIVAKEAKICVEKNLSVF
jgi:hypothetical protein